MGDSINYCEQCENRVGCHLARQCFHANDKVDGPLDAASCSIFERECCPHCGGRTGFTYRATIRGQQFMPWKNGKVDAYFEDSGSKHGAYRCDDCGKTVKSNASGQVTASGKPSPP